MFNFLDYSKLIFSFIAFFYIFAFILISYLKKIDFIFVLLCNTPLLIVLWIGNNLVLPQILSLVFLILASYFIINKNKLISVKYFLYSLFSVLVLVLHQDFHLYSLLLLCLLILFLASEKEELDRVFPLLTLSTICFTVSFLNINHRVINSNVAIIFLIFFLALLIKYIVVQKNFHAYFFIPFLALSSFINSYFIFFIMLLFIFYLVIYKLKYNCSIVSLFILLGSNIFIYSVSTYIKINSIGFSEYIEPAVFFVLAIAVAVYLEVNKKYYFNFKHILVSIFCVLLLFFPVFIYSFKDLFVISPPLVVGLIFIVLNSLFFSFFKVIRINSLSYIFKSESYSSLFRFIILLNKRAILLSYRFFKYFTKNCRVFLFSLFLFIKDVHLFLYGINFKISKTFVHFISKFDTYMLNAKIEALIFLVSVVVVLIVLLSEVL